MSQFIEMFGDKEFSIKKWSEVLTITNGKAYKEEYQENGIYPIYGSGGIMGYGDKKLCNGDTVILGRKGNINSPIYVKTDYWVVDTAFCLEVDKDVLDTKFFHYWCTQFNFLKFNKQAVLPSLTKSDLLTIEISIPSMDQQKLFVDIIEQADKSKFVGFKSQFIEMFEDHNYTSVPLAELIDKSFPGEWGTEDENGNGTKVIRTTNITNSDKLDLSDVVTRNIVAAKLQKKQLCRGDILLERSGGTKDNPVGRVAYFDEDGVFVTNNFTQTLRCNDNIESRYLFYFLYYFYNLNKMKIRSMGNQTTGIQNLNMDDYMQISVIVPPRDLQKRFISIVTQADKSKYFS